MEKGKNQGASELEQMKKGIKSGVGASSEISKEAPKKVVQAEEQKLAKSSAYSGRGLRLRAKIDSKGSKNGLNNPLMSKRKGRKQNSSGKDFNENGEVQPETGAHDGETEKGIVSTGRKRPIKGAIGHVKHAKERFKRTVAHGVGNTVKGTGKVVQKAGRAVQKVGRTVKNAGKTVSGTGKAVKTTGDAIKTSGTVEKGAGMATSFSGEVVEKTGEGVLKVAGASKIGALIGSGMVATGSGMQSIGNMTSKHGAKTQARGQKVSEKGKNIQQKGQSIQDKGQSIEDKGQEIENQGINIENSGEYLKNNFWSMLDRSKSKKNQKKKKRKKEAEQLVKATKKGAKSLIIKSSLGSVGILLVFIICVVMVIGSYIDGYTRITEGIGDIVYGATATNLNVTSGEPYRTINEEMAWATIKQTLVELGINIEDLGLGGSEEKAKQTLLKFYRAAIATSSLKVSDTSGITLGEGETLIDGTITIKRYDENGAYRTLEYIPTSSQTYIDLQTILNTNGGVIENPTNEQKTAIESCLQYYSVDSNGNLIIYYYTTQEIKDDIYKVGDYNSLSSEQDCTNFTLENYASAGITPTTTTKTVYTLYSETVNYEVLCQRYGISFDFLLALAMGTQDTAFAEAIADFALANTKIEVAIQDSYNYYQGETKYLYEGKFDRTDEAALLNIIGRAGESSSNLINYTDENSVNKQKGVYTGNTAGNSLWSVYTNKQSTLYEAAITTDYNTYAGMIDTIEQKALTQVTGLENTIFWNEISERLAAQSDPRYYGMVINALEQEAAGVQSDYEQWIKEACANARAVAAQDRITAIENLNTTLNTIKTDLEGDDRCNWCYKFYGDNTAYTGDTVKKGFNDVRDNQDADHYNFYKNVYESYGTTSIIYELSGIVDLVVTGKINSQVVPVSALVNENDGSWDSYNLTDILLPAKYYYTDALRVVTETKNEYSSYIYVKSAESWFLNEEFSLFDASVPSTTTEQASAEHTYQLGPKGGSGTQVLNLKYLMDTTEHEEKSEMDMTIEVPLKDGEIKYKKYEKSTVEKKQFSTISGVNTTDNHEIILGFLRNTDGSKPYDTSGNLYDKATLSASPYTYVADGGVNVVYNETTDTPAPITLMKQNSNIMMTLELLQRSAKTQADEQVYRYIIYLLTDGVSMHGIDSIDYNVFETKTFFSSEVYGFMDWIFPIAKDTIPDDFFMDRGRKYLASPEDVEEAQQALEDAEARGESTGVIETVREIDTIVHVAKDENDDEILEIYWDTSNSMAGTKVIATSDGEATFYLNDATYGNYIEIEHTEDGMKSYYYNLENFSDIYSQSADTTSTTKTITVEQGQVLGAVGKNEDGKYMLRYQVEAAGSVGEQLQYINFADPWGENFAEFVSYTMKYEGTDLATDERTDLAVDDGTFDWYVPANKEGQMENGFPIGGWHYAVHGGPNSQAIVGWAKQNSYGWDVTVGFGIALYYNLDKFQSAGLFEALGDDVQTFNTELTNQDTGRIYDIYKDSSGNWVKEELPITDEQIYEVNLKLMYEHYKGALDSLEAIGKDPKDYEVAQLVALAQVRWGCPGAFQGWISSYLDTDPVVIFQKYAALYASPGVNKRARESWGLYCTGDYDFEATSTSPWYDPTAEETENEDVLVGIIDSSTLNSLSEHKKSALEEAYYALGESSFKSEYVSGNEIELFKAWAAKDGSDESLAAARSAWMRYYNDNSNCYDISPLQEAQQNTDEEVEMTEELEAELENWRNAAWAGE